MKYPLFIFISICLFACGDTRIKLADDYYVWSTEGGSDMQIYYLAYGKYNIGMFGPRVYSVGVDSDFIIVKKHPVRDGKINRQSTLFYIIPLKDRLSTEGEKNYFGPFYEDGFLKKRHQLKVHPDLTFTINF